MRSTTLKLLALVSLAACGQFRPTASSPELEAYAVAFEEAALEHGMLVRSKPMVLVDSFSLKGNGEFQAICVSYRGKPSHVEVLRSTYEKLTDDGMEALTFHEQAHCALGLDGHDNSIALRAPVAPNGSAWGYSRTYLIDELFDAVNK
jgi:Zn-dependent protease with chaperone function